MWLLCKHAIKICLVWEHKEFFVCEMFLTSISFSDLASGCPYLHFLFLFLANLISYFLLFIIANYIDQIVLKPKLRFLASPKIFNILYNKHSCHSLHYDSLILKFNLKK